MNLDDLFGPSCVQCGASLEGKRADAVFCGYACFMEDYHQLAKDARLEAKVGRPPCRMCRKPIPVEAFSTRIYCSNSCQMRAHYVRSKKVPCKCRICGVDFFGMVATDKYCTPSCRAKAGVAVRAKKWKPKMTCIRCGTPFKARPAGQHCSVKCRSETARLAKES